MKKLAILLILAACGPAAVAYEMTTITISSGGFLGQSTTTIRADDLVAEHFVGMGRPDSQRVVPGAFTRALAVIEAEGPATAAKVKADGMICMDYGTDLVRIDPRLADFWMVTDDCPSEALHGFMTGVLAAVDP